MSQTNKVMHPTPVITCPCTIWKRMNSTITIRKQTSNKYFTTTKYLTTKFVCDGNIFIVLIRQYLLNFETIRIGLRDFMHYLLIKANNFVTSPKSSFEYHFITLNNNIEIEHLFITLNNNIENNVYSTSFICHDTKFVSLCSIKQSNTNITTLILFIRYIIDIIDSI